MEVLRLRISLSPANALDRPDGGVRMIPFAGRCDSPLFRGDILPGGVDTQRDAAPGECALSARYMLAGTDADGRPCRLFIENNAVSRQGTETVTHPRVVTDSPALRWLETASLTGRILPGEKGSIVIVISAPDVPRGRMVEVKRAGLTLRGLLSRPSDAPCPLVLMLHGFGGDMGACPGNLWQMISDRLLDAGLATLRFDFNGHGQSDGPFPEMTPYNEVEDAAAFLRFARELDGVTDIYVLGHSQGGVIAGMLAGYYHDVISRLVMLAPAASLKTDAQTGRCMAATYDPKHIPDSVNVDGRHHVGGLYFRMAQTLPIYEVTAQFAGPALIVFGEKDQVVALEASRRYTEGAARRTFALYPDLDHGLQGADQPAAMNRVLAFLRT